jgi:hypothetical protein
MEMSEVIERGLNVDENGKVLDEFGNEYRNEEGMVCYVEDEEK